MERAQLCEQWRGRPCSYCPPTYLLFLGDQHLFDIIGTQFAASSHPPSLILLPLTKARCENRADPSKDSLACCFLLRQVANTFQSLHGHCTWSHNNPHLNRSLWLQDVVTYPSSTPVIHANSAHCITWHLTPPPVHRELQESSWCLLSAWFLGDACGHCLSCLREMRMKRSWVCPLRMHTEKSW